MLLEKTEYNWNYNENTIHITGQFYEVKCPQEASDIVELDDMYQFMKSIHAQDKRWIQADARHTAIGVKPYQRGIHRSFPRSLLHLY